jgi:hypothetical protein
MGEEKGCHPDVPLGLCVSIFVFLGGLALVGLAYIEKRFPVYVGLVVMLVAGLLVPLMLWLGSGKPKREGSQADPLAVGFTRVWAPVVKKRWEGSQADPVAVSFTELPEGLRERPSDTESEFRPGEGFRVAPSQEEVTASDLAGSDWPPIWCAAMRGDCDDIRRLLSAGADANAPGDQGCTPLHVAAVHGRSGAVDLLLGGGADPNRTDPHGNGPLWAAVHQACLARRSEANLAVVRSLLASGADPDHKNHYGRSPRDVAQERDETVAALFSNCVRDAGLSGAADRPRERGSPSSTAPPT